MDITKPTRKQVIAVDRAIGRVRDATTQQGMTLPGCILPVNIMVLNAWNQSQVQAAAIAVYAKIDDIKKGLIDKNNQWKENGFKDYNKQKEAYLNEIVENITLKTYPLKDLKKIDEDEYFRRVNEKNPVPQEYFSLLMEANLIEMEAKEEPKEEPKKK